MPNRSTSETWPTLRRAWIERTAARQGAIQRSQICAVLGISAAQASADLQALQAEHPGCLTYDMTGKTYRWAGKKVRTIVPDFVRDL